jgi:hypothetical protein
MYGRQIQRWKLSFTPFDSYTSSKIQCTGQFAAMGGELDAFLVPFINHFDPG